MQKSKSKVTSASEENAKLAEKIGTDDKILTSIYKARIEHVENHMRETIKLYNNGLITGAECAARMLAPK